MKGRLSSGFAWVLRGRHAARAGTSRGQRLDLSVSPLNISFPLADPDTVPIVSSLTAQLTYRVRQNNNQPWTLTVLAMGDLISGLSTVDIGSVSWIATPAPPFQNGTLSKTVAQRLAGGDGNINPRRPVRSRFVWRTHGTTPRDSTRRHRLHARRAVSRAPSGRSCCSSSSPPGPWPRSPSKRHLCGSSCRPQPAAWRRRQSRCGTAARRPCGSARGSPTGTSPATARRSSKACRRRSLLGQRMDPPRASRAGHRPGKDGIVRFNLTVPQEAEPAGYRTGMLFEFSPSSAPGTRPRGAVPQPHRHADLRQRREPPIAVELTDLATRTIREGLHVIAVLKNTSSGRSAPRAR